MRIRAASVAAATSLACLLGPVAITASAPAQAERPHVTKAAYGKVKHGWKITRVHRTFGIEGRKIQQGGGHAIRIYDGWTFCMRIYVDYRMVDGVWRLNTKESRIDTDCAP